MKLQKELKEKLKSINNFSQLFAQKNYIEIYNYLGNLSSQFSQILIDEQVETGYDFLSDIFKSFGDSVPCYAFSFCDFKGLTLDINPNIKKINRRSFYMANNFKLNNKKISHPFDYLDNRSLAFDENNSDQIEEITLNVENRNSFEDCLNTRIKILNLVTKTDADISFDVSKIFTSTKPLELEDIIFPSNIKLKFNSDVSHKLGFTDDADGLKDYLPNLSKNTLDKLLKEYRYITPDDVIEGKLYVNEYKEKFMRVKYPDINSIQVDSKNKHLIADHGCLFEYCPIIKSHSIIFTTSTPIYLNKKVYEMYMHKNLREMTIDDINNAPDLMDFAEQADKNTSNKTFKINIIKNLDINNANMLVHTIKALTVGRNHKLIFEIHINIGTEIIDEFLTYLSNELNNKSKRSIRLILNDSDYTQKLNEVKIYTSESIDRPLFTKLKNTIGFESYIQKERLDINGKKSNISNEIISENFKAIVSKLKSKYKI